MRRLRTFLTVLLSVLIVGVLDAPLSAQSIQSVSDRTLLVGLGGAERQLRIDGAGLAGVTEVRFLKDGRIVRGIQSKVEAGERSVLVTVVADRAVGPLDGIRIELRGPRIRQPITVPAMLELVPADASGRPLDRQESDGDRASGGKVGGSGGKTDSGGAADRGGDRAPDPTADAAIQPVEVDFDRFHLYVGDRMQGRVTLSAPPSQPMMIELVSERPASVSLPNTVTVPAGQTFVNFEIEALAPHTGSGLVLPFAVQARKVPYSEGPERTLRVAYRPSISGVAFTTGGAVLTSTQSGSAGVVRIRLSEPPRAGGTIQLDASGPVSVQPSLTLPEGEEEFHTVPVTFGDVTTPTNVQITASGFDGQRSASITVNPAGLVFVDSVALEDTPYLQNPTVVGGEAVRLGVGLSTFPSAGGYDVPVQVSDPALLSVLPLTIPEDETTGVLVVSTQPTANPTVATVTVGDAAPFTVPIQIRPPRIDAVSVDGPAFPGAPAAVTVTLDGLAPGEAGLTIPLRTERSDLLSIPEALTVPPGAYAASFDAAFASGAVLEPPTLSVPVRAELPGSATGVEVEVRRWGRLASLSVSGHDDDDPDPILRVHLDGPAPPGGTRVGVSSSHPDVLDAHEESVVAGGTDEVLIPLDQGLPSQNTTVTLYATVNGIERSAQAMIEGLPQLVSLSGPSTLQGAGTLSYFVSLTGQISPDTPLLVDLQASNPTVQLPTTLTIASTQDRGFQVVVPAVETEEVVTLTATAGDVVATRTLTLIPIPPPAVPTMLSVADDPLTHGSSTTLTLTLDHAGDEAVIVDLSSTSPDLTVPTTLTVPAGSSTATVDVQSQLNPGWPPQTATITAVNAQGSASVSVELAELVTGVALTAGGGAVAAGSSLDLEVAVSGRKDAPPTSVALTSSNPAVLSVPSSITVVPGPPLTFQAQAGAVSAATTVTLTAVVGGHDATVEVTVQPSGGT